MGICVDVRDKLPKSTIYKAENKNDKIYKNALGILNFNELFMQSLSPEFLILFKNNVNLFCSQPFLEGISYEYGLMEKPIKKDKAFKVYKDGADNKYDYCCMYRLHRIFLNDYENFNLQRNIDLDRLYLYKCFAYLPFTIIDKIYFLFNKIDVVYETAVFLDEDNKNEEKNFATFEKFIKYLRQNPKKYNLTRHDVDLMNNVILTTFFPDAIKNKIEFLDYFLNFDKGDNAYYESRLKYCNFYLKNAEENSDKSKIKEIFNELIKDEYYKASYDYGNFLMKEGKYEEAKNIFKKGMENSQQFCLGEYTYLILREIDLNQLISDYEIISFFFKNMCLVISHDNLSRSSLYYAFYYLTKYSSFKEQLKNDFYKYIKELYQNEEKRIQINNSEHILNNYAENYLIEIPWVFGIMCYYGICDYLNPNKEKALFYFKRSYKLAKEKLNIYKSRINYLYIYKCRKNLYKNQKISLIKLNKTKEKIFRIYENENEENFDIIELYNYYKLYKMCVTGNIQDKLIHLLKKGKNIKIYYSFIDYICIHKCKIALDKEYSNFSSLNQKKIILKNEDDKNNKNKINLYFKTMEGGNSYKVAVSKDTQFFKAVHKLFNNYPELELKKIGTYLCNAKKISLFDTVEENGLIEGSTILIINKFQ